MEFHKKIIHFFFVGWLGYTDEYRRSLCKKYLADGFTAFKLKVGQNIDDDRHRCKLIREEIGWENKLVRGKFLLYCSNENGRKVI